jgi:hypothetical protein
MDSYKFQLRLKKSPEVYAQEQTMKLVGYL